MKPEQLTKDEYFQLTLEWLRKRGIQVRDIAELTYFLQENFIENLSIETCEESVLSVLHKREIQNAILTGIQIDILAEQNQLEEPLLSIIRADDSLYGIDEVLSIAILNVYGSIGFTNYGYVDRLKPGVLKRLNDKSDGQIHTFLDDLVGAVAAAAAARLAHDQRP